MRRPVLSLLLLALVTFGLGLGRPAVTDADEAYYAEAAREMLDSGDWVTPRYNFTDRWQKPVLYYWLTAATYAVAGAGAGTARLWAALSGVGLVLLVWAIARRMPLSREDAWLAGAIVATCYGYFAMARSALPDLPLAFCITATIAAAFRAFDEPVDRGLRWWCLAGAAAGLGLLMKGPVALAVPAVVLAPAWWLERRTVTLHWPSVAAAAVLALVIALPWYLLMTARHGTAYLDSFFVGDNLERFATSRFNDARPIWFYLPVIAGGLLPWTALGGVAAVTGLVAAARRQWTPSREEARLLLWAAMPVVFFSASVGQQPRYVLPVLPPLAILLARAIGRRVADAGTHDRAGWALRVATGATIVLFALCAALLLRLRPLLADGPWLWVGVAGIVAATAALAAVAARGAWRRLPVTATVAAALLLLGVQAGVLTPPRPEPVQEMAAQVLAHRASAERIGPYRAFVRSLVFYTGIEQEDLYDAARASAFLASPDRVLLIVPEHELPALAAAAGVRPRTLAAVRYVNIANIRLRTFLAPDPAREAETVLLVTNR